MKRTCLSRIKSTFRHEKAVRVSARWVPRFLTVYQKRVRMNLSNALLAQFRRNKFEFWGRLITEDVTWIHHYTFETKIQSKQWTAKGEPAPKKLFFHLKIALGVQRFSSNEEAITFVNSAEKHAEYYLNELQRWKHRWE